MVALNLVSFSQALANTVPEARYLIPGGQSIGVKLKSKGAMVVGYYKVDTIDGSFSPAEKAGISKGDYILKINNREIKEIGEVSEISNDYAKDKKSLRVLFSHEGALKETNLTPGYNTKEKSYQMGMFLRDFAAGIGTLTFFEPTRNSYGALGHAITDADTNNLLSVGKGSVYKADITSIEKGKSGEPGEKRGIFINEDKVIGDIYKNTHFGIFGKLKPDLLGLGTKGIPVAEPEEVMEGPAKILTVVDGTKVQEYSIEILEKNNQSSAETKGLVLKITDPNLLNKTGGIVQGMSGSPIIQNGKIVGAVTHVLVNDPTSGYGTYIKWMLHEADNLTKKVS